MKLMKSLHHYINLFEKTLKEIERNIVFLPIYSVGQRRDGT
ncbi:hypothetical protein S3E15_05623 [Bacillus mycoides]|uniref:Uncharacterized protein n=1 Tax=Bacillus mycoides TaxID=1405 RepID=A0AAP7W8K4_BACMY|nr:hypothetical protein bcere0007_19790 [Bacillus mycoides]EEL99670.1 hypothetical protein bmyco0001_18870 [Bacillus mycoides DSM 2048]KIV65644.1 hypothetical protein SZ39_5047 [Bacillus mycoides]KUH44068.1 hypothetical protein M2E15_5577 [Bacillus mycoides]KZE03181.1 hypothetical protein B4117_5064 [Bacillus mycoides]